MDNKLVYDEIASHTKQLLPEHKKVIDWVGKDKKVLEVACHSGYVSARLQQNNCKVTGVEIYEPALKKAKPYLYKSVLGDIEKEETWNKLSDEKFDVILFMHILEHLIDPETILVKSKLLLNENGSVIICLPNINNWVNRWDIFKGNFNYTSDGVMDKTHFKFYNFFTAKKMIEAAGYNLLEYSGVSWKVRFQIVPNRWIGRKFNDFYTSLLHKILSPNLTDKIIMFKAEINNQFIENKLYRC
jgi:2-polyprenyl-3-methyl-5-hydroxy-6-metoxy-1,4-benzoquinol methylase